MRQECSCCWCGFGVFDLPLQRCMLSAQRSAAVQVNKNVLLKARVGTDAAVASLAFKAWWQPSFTLGASAGYDMQTRRPVFGFVLNCENYGNIR